MKHRLTFIAVVALLAAGCGSSQNSGPEQGGGNVRGSQGGGDQLSAQDDGVIQSSLDTIDQACQNGSAGDTLANGPAGSSLSKSVGSLLTKAWSGASRLPHSLHDTPVFDSHLQTLASSNMLAYRAAIMQSVVANDECQQAISQARRNKQQQSATAASPADVHPSIVEAFRPPRSPASAPDHRRVG